MGKSTSCFKIITCGNDSADKDELDVSESKGSNDKRGWSFRKRSARHRVLSNTVITENPTSLNKESSESATLNFQSPVSTTIPEKVSVVQFTDEKPQLLIPEKPSISETENAIEEQSKVDGKLDESSVIVVQTAVRGLLAQRSLLELKNVVKLQAAVRGHLERRRAVGTLRCVQAIVKMQSLVRARRTRLSLEQSHDGGKHEKDKRSFKIANKANATYISIEKLLSNRFAQQLLESTPKTQPIHIKCDPSKPDSAWKWLEMWMAVSTAETPSKEALSVTEQREAEREENSESPLESKSHYYEMAESNSSVKESIGPSEIEENLITYDADNLNFQASHSTSYSVRDNNEQPHLENISTSDVKETSVGTNYLPTESVLSEADSNMEIKACSGQPGVETEQPKRSMKRSASEQLETDGKKSSFGSRKVTNPAFIAAQSKFEGLSSTTNSSTSIIVAEQEDSGVESQMDTFSSGVDTGVREKELSVEDNLISDGSRVQVGGSDCGTEISISSTLDSPDRFDVGAVENDLDTKVSESTRGTNVEAKDIPELPVSNLCDTATEQPEKLDVVNGASTASEDAQQVALTLERTTSDLRRDQDTEASVQAAYGSSPEGSLRSHLTVPESQGTPSSLISVKAKRNKADKSGSNKKRLSLSAGKNSPSNPNHDSGSSKDQKSGKRRNSFGSAKPDHVDQEPRDSSSSSIPHFMQATESARAKLLATASPRSSPDMQDRDIYIKKRHSLPGANGRQESPRIQRSTSQEKPGAKGTERKWQR